MICRYGSYLLIGTVSGTAVQCIAMDVMSPVLNAKVLFEIPMTVGHPLSIFADVMMDNRSFIRIVCANGILVGHPDGVSTVAGEYSEYIIPGRKGN